MNVWTPSMDALLLQLRDERGLTFGQIRLKFNGRFTASAVACRYYRITAKRAAKVAA